MWGLVVCLISAITILHSTTAVSLCEGCKEVNLNADGGGTGKRYIQWEDVFNLTLAPRYASIHWTKDGHTAYEGRQDGYYKINAKTGDPIKKYFEVAELFGYDFTISPDETHAIFYILTKSKYRYSFYADYWVVSLAEEDKNADGIHRKNVTILPEGTKDVQYCGFTPTGHTLIVVADFNLYTKTDPLAEGAAAYSQHTTDGKDNVIFNGVPDWVYEEEVVSNYYSNYPSPDSRFIAFTKTNAEGVRHVKFPIYGDEDYSTILDYEYPKAGYKNPTIETYVTDLADPDGNMAAYHLPTPDEVTGWGDHYLYTVSWADSGRVICEWWNRNQTKISFYECVVSRVQAGGGAACTKLFSEESKGGWMDWWSKPLWWFDKDTFATLLPSPQTIYGNFKHICLFTRGGDGTWTRQFLTKGKFDILQIYAMINTDTKKYLFYQSTMGGQMYRHVFKLDVQTSQSTCLSCDGYCGYASASFSADSTMYRLTCYGPVTPYVQLKEVDDNWVKVLETNSDLDMTLRGFELPKATYMTENIGGFDVNVQRVTPPDFDENGTRKYPVLLYVYGGPDSGNVKDTYRFGEQRKEFHNYLANGDPSKPQFIVYYVDVRGTLGRGDDFRFPLYKKFGKTEVEDTLDFLEKVSKYDYVDSGRMAIWGWSYGGFLTAKVTGSGRRLVQAAISVAPVTSYRFYDTIYTERYMGQPDDNPLYETGDCLHEAANYHGTKFFLIHGSADDNVHYTNSARLAYQLVENNVQFRMHAYTDKAHSLSGSATRRHLYTMMRDWLFEVLNFNDHYLGTYKVFN